MDLFPHPSPNRSWSWIKDDFRTVPRVHLGLPEGTIGDYTVRSSSPKQTVGRESSRGTSFRQACKVSAPRSPFVVALVRS